MSDHRKSLLSALYSVDASSFNSFLFEIVRWHALRYCNAQVNKPIDCDLRNTSEPGESEFSQLKHCLFSVFEAFIAGATFPSPEVLSDLEKRLNPLVPGGHTICGHILQQNEPVYSCSDCAVDPTCVLCRSCFFKSVHLKHSYKMHTSMGGGYCDCGDVEAWRSGACCTDHLPAKVEGDIGPYVGAERFADPENAVELDLESEFHSIRGHLQSLPKDVLLRTSRLLEPLLRSTIVCLCDLLQATRPFTTKPVSDKNQNLDCLELVGSFTSVRDLLLDFNGTIETTDKKAAPQLADDLWPYDDNVVNESADIPSVVEDWPPPISHIPLVSPSLDASQLGEDSWPRTAPKSRTAFDVEQRALAQLARARRLHPRLFPPRPTRTASERTAASHSFVVVLHNNEYHNYEQVIKTLRRVLSCTTQQATHHAVVVNRDGRSVLQTNLGCSQAAKIAASLMRTSTSLSTRPLHASCEHADIYSMSVFFTLVLRWITHLSNEVPSLRPVICHALLGFFAPPTPMHSAETTCEILPVVTHGEAVRPHSWLDAMMERHCLTWRAVRSEALHVVMGVLLRESFYRRVFAIHFTRSYSKLLQQYLYDDHAEKDNLFCLSCQVFTVISLARHLLERNNVLTRMLSRLEAAFEANSLVLPDFYSTPGDVHQGHCTTSDEHDETLCSSGSDPSWFAFIIDTLRRANPFEWGSSSCRSFFGENRSVDTTSSDEDAGSSFRAPAEPRVLHWQAGTLLHRTRFHPFERLLEVVRDISYILGSLTNVRPLYGDSLYPKGWWNAAGRSSFLDYIRSLLRVLSYIQDMSGMQRETRGHVADDTEWASGIYIVNHLVSLLGLTAQVASSDYQLFKDVLRESRQAFEYRVGIMDRRFRVAPLPSVEDDREGRSPGVNQSACSRNLSFQSLGVTTEVYAYDVATYRVSLLQPLPRFLASLYGHGVEMGISFEELGLLDKAFANLLIERPLQILAFYAQYNAKMWVRNGYSVQTSVANMFATGLRVELIERDFQLLQLAAAVMPPDEFIVRMIHKMQLQNYLDPTATNEPAIGRVQAAEFLLRTIFTLLTDRSRPGIGQFSTDYLQLQSPHLPPDRFLLTPDLEQHYASLVDAVIHTLCLKAMSCSQLMQLLPCQPLGCLIKVQSDELSTPVTSPSTFPTTVPTSVEDIRPALVSGRANKRAIEHVLPRILRQVATESTVNGRVVFAIKPEVIVGRFLRFHWGYRHTEQNMAESYVSKILRQWLQDDARHTGESPSIDWLPLPPPVPRPVRKFTPAVASGLLGLIRCPTFVRLLRALLDVALDHGTSAIWWSDTLLDLVLHLIQVALYEDELEHSVSGSLPFLDTVAQVPLQRESKQDLENLARRQNWLEPTPTAEHPLEYASQNCLTLRLVNLLQNGRHEEHMELIQWTLNHWNAVVHLRKQVVLPEPAQLSSEGPFNLPIALTKSLFASARQQRVEMAKARRAKIMERMSNMQRSFMSGHIEKSLDTVAVDTHPMEVEENSFFIAERASPTASPSALGPDRVVSMFLPTEPPTDIGEMVTCNLCLEDVPATPQSRMVFTAHVCRSSVISSRASSWCEGSRAISMIKQLLDLSPNMHGVRSDDEPPQPSDAATADSMRDFQLNEFLAALSTTAAAASPSSLQTGFYPLPELSKSNQKSKDEAESTAHCPYPFYGMLEWRCQFEDSSLSHFEKLLTDELEGSTNRPLDPWRPRPLVASRAPVAEEGSFVLCCSHPMHAACKVKFARQLKARVDHLNRHRDTNLFVFEFRCPSCKSISNLDLPVLGSFATSTPWQWLRARLLSAQPGSSGPRARFQPLVSWLDRLQQWLRLPIAEGIGCPLDTSEPKDSLNQFYKGLDDAAKNEEGLSGNPLLLSVLTRLFDILSVQQDQTSIPVNRAAAISDASGMNAEVSRPWNRSSRRYYWRTRLSARRRPDVEPNSNRFSSSYEPSVSRQRNALDHLLPKPPEPPAVSTSLFVMVQQLSALCQPRPLESLLHRPLRRTANDYLASVGTETVSVPEVAVDIEEEEDYETAFTIGIGQDMHMEIGLHATALMDSEPAPISLSRSDRTTSTSQRTSGQSRNESELFPLPLHRAIDRFYLSLQNFCERLCVLDLLGSSAQSSTAGASSRGIADSAVQDKSSKDELYELTRLALSSVYQHGRDAVLSAAHEWRALRHTVAYTLISSERAMRHDDPREHFLNGGLAERHLRSMGTLLRVSLAAHARHAVVSPGCPSACTSYRPLKTSIGEMYPNHNFCWPQLRDHSMQWWWWSYCAPLPKGSPEAPCRSERPMNLNNVAEHAVRVAATEDARYLWGLLVPHFTLEDTHTEIPLSLDVMLDSIVKRSLSGYSHGTLSLSLLWEVDITFLFISLLHLRPGLEEDGLVECQCQRDSITSHSGTNSETVASDLSPSLLSCDHGRPREPIGDSHEAHLLRLCYTALLTQSILSWTPGCRSSACSELCASLAVGTSTDGWSSPQLIQVWRRLRILSELSDTMPATCDDIEVFAHELGVHLRANCLPFLRIAAYVMNQITGVDVPEGMRSVRGKDETATTDLSMEYSLLLSYLGLPSGPSDLFVILPEKQEEHVSSHSILHMWSQQAVASSSESLWIARLITSWCLIGRGAPSRQLYNQLCARIVAPSFSNLVTHFMTTHSTALLPSPNLRLPKLVPLPREYTTLLSLTTNYHCLGGHVHSDPSVCLICGHLACLVCYACRQVEPGDTNAPLSSTSRREPVVYDMQAHSRRCHSGYSLVLQLHACRVFLLSDDARRFSELSVPYRDVYGEMDVGLLRGNPLFLVDSEYKRLNRLWLNHQSASSTSIDLLTPPNLELGLL